MFPRGLQSQIFSLIYSLMRSSTRGTQSLPVNWDLTQIGKWVRGVCTSIIARENS